ncbi:MAG: hypothetical protein Q8P22_11915 [Chloroflexota bacterium]|nr:hypothetical protein [Chloroflexota bacterium]
MPWFWTKLKRERPRKRTTFGFACDPGISAVVKLLARKLEVPIYPLAEHVLQLGLAQVLALQEDEEFKKALQQHLAHQHLLVPLLNEENEYDLKAIAMARTKGAGARISADNVRRFLHVYEVAGVSLERIKQALDKLEEEVLEERRLRGKGTD